MYTVLARKPHLKAVNWLTRRNMYKLYTSESCINYGENER